MGVAWWTTSATVREYCSCPRIPAPVFRRPFAEFSPDQIVTLLKDDSEHAVPPELRGRFGELIAAFAAGNFAPEQEGVAPITIEVARLIAGNVVAYGDVLVPLRDEAWARSAYRWMDGYWQVIVDLSTNGEPVSDLALHARIMDEPGLPVLIDGVWVP